MQQFFRCFGLVRKTLTSISRFTCQYYIYMTLRYVDAQWYAKGSIIYELFPQTAIKGIVSAQTNIHTYDLIPKNYYKRIVLNAVSATLLKLQAIIRVIKLRRIQLYGQSVQLDINDIRFIHLVGTMIDCTVAVRQKYSNAFQHVRWIK